MPNNLILNYHDACIYESDVALLLNNEWLNDACINYGMTRLSTRFKAKFMNKNQGFDPQPFSMKFLDPSVISYFMFQLSLDDSDDIEEFCGLCSCWGLDSSTTTNPTILLLPINDHHSTRQQLGQDVCNNLGGAKGNHWSLMMVVKTTNNVHFFHFDSSPGYNHLAAEAISKRITSIISLKSKCGGVSCSNAETILECKVPRQMNGYDCGIHVLITAEILLEEFTNKTFSQDLFYDPIKLNDYCASKVLIFMRTYPNLCQMGIEKRKNLTDSIRLEAAKLACHCYAK